MEVNFTAPFDQLIGIYTLSPVYFCSAALSTTISSILIYLLYKIPNLRTPSNFLLLNTCLCCLFFCEISFLNILPFIYPYTTTMTDWSCRIQGYLTYVSISLVLYSLVAQASSRLFYTVLYKYCYLLSIKCHIYLLILQILLSFLCPLSAIISTNITFRPFKACLVPIHYSLHCLYLFIVICCIPIIIIIIFYIIIYRYTVKSRRNRQTLALRTKRERKLATNILILLSIFIFCAIASSLHVILSNGFRTYSTSLYLFSLSTPAIGIICEKIAIIVLNRHIRKVAQQQWLRLSYRLFPIRVAPSFRV